MISFVTPSLKTNPTYLKLLNENFFEFENFKSCWESYLELAKSKNRVIGNPTFRLGVQEINVMGIRNNPEISFNETQYFYNDILVIQFLNIIEEVEFYVYQVTMDPKGKQYKIAHLLEGVYGSYKANRPHKWIPGRDAITQDRNSVYVARTDSEGTVIISKHEGTFGINIHDSDKYWNSSLGCTVLPRDSAENGFHYKNSFKPLLKQVSNKESVDYCVVNKDAVFEILESIKHKKVLPLSIFDTAFSALKFIRLIYV